jgi:hypothetical protein
MHTGFLIRIVLVRSLLLCICIGAIVSLIPLSQGGVVTSSRFEDTLKREVSLEFIAEKRF